MNGHMFSYLSKTGTLALRLPEETRDAFLKKFKTTLCKQYGVVQKEYVEVPDACSKKTSELKKVFRSELRSREFLEAKTDHAEKVQLMTRIVSCVGTTLFLVFRDPGPSWVPGLQSRQQPLWDEHAAFMDAMF